MNTRRPQNKYAPSPFAHGGDLRKGLRKTARPLIVRNPVHIVMRSLIAQEKLSMLHPRNTKRVSALVRKASRRFDVEIHRFVNVGNHLHLLVKARGKRHFQNFLRYLCGQIAMLITGAKKGRTVLKICGTPRERQRFYPNIEIPDTTRFWDSLVFTRLVSLGLDYDRVVNYLKINLLESFGLIERKKYKRTPRVWGDIEWLLGDTS